MTRLINYSNACNVLDSSRCMQYQITSRSSPSMQQNIVCKISHPSYILDIKSLTIIHVCMNIWLNNNAYVHKQFTTSSPFICHICNHQQNHHHLTYMHSPTISQSINIYVFTNDITINQQHHIISHNPNKGENTSY